MDLLPSRDIFCKNRGTVESILVFTSTLKRTSIYSFSNHHKYEADSSEWDFEDDDTQEHLHTLHPYPARFIPQIPRKAILEYSREGDIVLDPFCGCGTTLLESILLGRPGIGVDNNEVACLIARAKVASYTKKDLLALQEFAANLYSKLPEAGDNLWVPDYESISYWFDESVIKELSRLRAAIDELPDPVLTFALAVFSAIIVRASYQDSDTRYARVEKAYIPGSVIEWFQSKLFDGMGRLMEIMDKPRENARVHLADGRELRFINDDTVNLIVTSPPYLNAYDYHKYHRHRLYWLDADVQFARDEEIGKHDVFTRPGAKPDQYFDDMTRCFKEWSRILRKGGKAIVVIGDAIVSGESVPVADRFIEIMGSLNIELEKRWIRRLQKEKKSFNRNARIDREHVLLFEKY
jgi:site-specific DNA-methyltransferase (cytosine-N4-specific)